MPRWLPSLIAALAFAAMLALACLLAWGCGECTCSCAPRAFSAPIMVPSCIPVCVEFCRVEQSDR